MRQHSCAIPRAALCAAAVVLLLVGSSALADEARTARLEALCRVWAAAKYSHPAMLTREVDWDGALIRAIPRVRQAATDADLAAAIDGMLRELGDPATHVNAPKQKKSVTAPTALLRHDGDVVVVNAGPAVDWNSFDALWGHSHEVSDELAKASGAVVDITTADPDAADAVSSFISGTPLWTTSAVDGVPSWTTFYSGYAPQRSFTSGGYYSALMLRAGSPIAAAKSAPRRLAFVTDGKVPLPPAVVALWRAGKAAIVSSSPVSDASDVRRIAVAGGYEAQIRTGEYAIASIAADVVAPDPLDAAVKFVRGIAPLQQHDGALRTPAARQISEPPYAGMVAPDLPHRLLAAFRIWSTIDDFYPYKALIGDWDAVLREFIPRFEEAEGEEAYAEAVLEMTAHIEDGHTGAYGHPAVAKILPPAFLPFVIDRIEGAPVVVRKFDPAAPVALGDVIVSVDGEPMDARIKRLWKYVAGATEPARMARVMNMALHGAPGLVAHLEVRGADGAVHAVDVPRLASLPQTKSDTPWRVLDGNIGYADLRLLTVAQVDPMFDALMKTRAIIFDMRGYPKGTAWRIAPRINTRHATIGARFRRPQLSGAGGEEESSPGYTFEQALPTSDLALYLGKVVVLINDQAISQSEHSCLFFEQAAGATFIGTPTAGSNGDITNFVLPGGFIVTFTGHDVRHADGRQLQRVGIQPDVRVEPTIAGLRAGKDEVLDRAVAWIESGAGSAASPGIAEFNAALDSATRRMDNAAVMALWAEDGVSLLPSHAPIVGKQAIAAFLDSVTSSYPGARMESFQMECHDVRTSGDWASEWCSEHQVVRFSGGQPPFDGRGKMLLVLRKNAAGAWKLMEEMWNQGTASDE